MGSAATYHLAARGCKVLAMEQHTIPNELGSSHGTTRIIRLGYAEGKKYVPMLRRAYRLWKDIEQTAGEQLLFITGGIDASPLKHPDLKKRSLVEGTLESCRAYEIKHEFMTHEQLHERFPAFHLPEELVAVYQPQSGFVLAERSVEAHVSAALDLGAEIHVGEEVLKWEVHSGEVTVRTDREWYRARRLVITAGPWVARSVPQLKDKVKPERQVMIWVQPKRPKLFQMGAFPVFYMEDGKDKYYGFPVNDKAGFKIGKYNHLKEPIDPATVDRKCHARDEKVLRKAISKYFHGADGPTIDMKTCIFSNTEDEDFILDLHPDFSQVSIAAGFSGHGFKFCPVVGEIMADLALEGGSKSFNLDPFRFDRL